MPISIYDCEGKKTGVCNWRASTGWWEAWEELLRSDAVKEAIFERELAEFTRRKDALLQAIAGLTPRMLKPFAEAWVDLDYETSEGDTFVIVASQARILGLLPGHRYALYLVPDEEVT